MSLADWLVLDEVRAVTVRQPWCWAQTHEAAAPEHHKPIENRSWYTNYRGLLALHAGARSRWDPAGEYSQLVRKAWSAWCGANWLTANLARNTEHMQFGAIVAITHLLDVHHASKCQQADGTLCNRWAVDGQFHLVLGVVKPLEPIVMHGQRRLWPVPDAIAAQIHAQLAGHGAAA